VKSATIPPDKIVFFYNFFRRIMPQPVLTATEREEIRDWFDKYLFPSFLEYIEEVERGWVEIQGTPKRVGSTWYMLIKAKIAKKMKLKKGDRVVVSDGIRKYYANITTTGNSLAVRLPKDQDYEIWDSVLVEDKNGNIEYEEVKYTQEMKIWIRKIQEEG